MFSQAEITDRTHSCRTLPEASDISIDPESFMGTSKGCVGISIALLKGDWINLLSQLNILINNEDPPEACISDFGLSILESGARRGDAGGTFGYMAPELLFSENAQPSKATDMYAFGIVVYEVITGTRALGELVLEDLPQLTAQALRPSRPVTGWFGRGTWKLIEECWDEDCEKRPTAETAMLHFRSVSGTAIVVQPSPLYRSVRRRARYSMLGSIYKYFCECRGLRTVSPL